jgi:hypothetical protein
MERDERREQKKNRKVSFSEEPQVRTIERKENRKKVGEMDSVEDQEDDRKRDREDEEDDDEEATKQASAQAEKSRRKKRKLLAGVEEDSENSGEDYEGEERPDEEVFEEEFNSGIRLESFNLREEYRDGVIDLSTGAIKTRAAREEEEDEDWLKEYENKMKDDAYATKMEKLRGKWAEDDAHFEEETKFSRVDSIRLLEEASDVLYWGESVSKALNRLRPKQAHVPKKSGTTAISSNSNSTGKKEEDEETPFVKLTNAADKLLNAEGLVDIYSMTKEELMDHLDKIKAKIIQWVYKWPNAEEEYGPYTNDQMKGWLDEGYFSFEEGKYILVRKIVEGDQSGSFAPLVDNIF